MDSQQKQKEKAPFIIVGIGASAGGLAVLKKFVKSLPEQSGMAYIIIQHLDPTHKSMLSELLAKECRIPLQDAEDGQTAEADHVYVIPPNTYLTLEGDTIRLSEPEESRGSRKAIDHFFRSLASERGDRCAGVILSGSGSDGTAGLRAIKATGGLVLAQEPDTAGHASMPDSAIEANVVDKICDVEDMTEVLSRFASHPMTLKRKDSEEVKAMNAGQSLGEIDAILKAHENFYLSQYKPSTVQRRINRRMSLTDTLSYEDYLQKLREDQYERRQLTKDLLINVTDFFRDPQAFEVLESKAIPDTLDQVRGGEDIRVWIAGCASGEEAYSVAILLREALKRRKMTNDIKIFATDIDEHAIKIARRGIYPGSIAEEVPKKYLERYFYKVENDHHYKVKRQIRDLISFAVQNVATDPPFHHMHLISCRNLLIYFNREVQQRVLSSFYFALDDHGYLFLGSSESLGNKAELFKTVSKKWRLYRKIPGQNQRKVMLDHLHIEKNSPANFTEKPGFAQTQRRGSSSRGELMRRSILEAATPPTVLVDEEGRVLFSHGDLEDYLDFPKGEPRYDLAQVVKPAMRSRVRSALYKVKKSGEKLSFHCALDDSREREEKRYARVEITPISNPEYTDGQAYVVVFQQIAPPANGHKENLSRDDENRAHADLEQELAETREELQNTVEELETSTEELKASHEEALSTNEELQSSNEELEASSEELRSLNEELSTVNAQLKEKIADLKTANDDVENFFASTDLPTIFLGPELKIKRYTPAAEHLLKMGPGDVGRPISSLGRDLVDENLTEECKEVLRNFLPQRREIQDYRGRWYIRQLTPYRTEDRRIEGVVIVFQDVTELKELSRRAEGREKQQAVVAHLGMLALSGTAPEELMRQAVRQVAHVMDADMCKILQYQPEQENFLMTAGVGWHEGLVGTATVPDSQDSQAGYTLIASDPVIVSRLDQEKRFSGPDLLIEHQVVSGISCPINHSDPPYGVLSVHTRQERNFTRDDANFLQSVANMLSTALRTRLAQQQVYQSESKFRAIANSIPQLAWMTDETGYIFWYNQRWFDYTGTTLEEMKGWGWQKVHHPDHVERVVESVSQCFESGEEWEDTFPLRGKDGNYRWFLSRAKPIRDQQGKIMHWFGSNTDITEKLEQEAALKQSEEKLRLAKDSARLGLFEYDIQNNQVSWEPMLHKIWGTDPGDTITRETFFDGLHPEDIEHTRQAIEASTDPAGDGHYEVTYRVINRHSRQTFWIIASGSVQFEDGKALRMIGLVNDVSRQKKLEISQQQAIEEAKAAALAKDEFLSTMSHEIRTPLNAIIGLSNLLLSNDPRPDQEDRLNVLKFSSQGLLNLINDILDYSKIEAGKVELEQIHFKLPALLDDMCRTYSFQAEHKSNQISCIIDEETPDILLGDPHKLSQVLNNLFSNANKFTENGRIEIKVKLLEQKGEQLKLHFSLNDTGIGIPPDKLQTIFEKFSQADSSTVRRYGGTGLGLSISKALVELLGGSIEVDSRVGEGTVFSFTLPMLVGDPEQLTSEKAATATRPVDLSGEVKILMAEDTGINRMVLQQHLQEWLGIQADEAENGLEAVEKAAQQRYDLILMDIRMPGMDGVEASRRIREQQQNAGVPILALTADTRIPDLANGEEELFDQVVTKPFDPDELRALLYRLLPGASAPPGGKSQAGKSTSPKKTDFTQIKERFTDEETRLIFMEKADTALRSFREDYFGGLQEADPERVSDAIHKAKVLFDILGQQDLYEQMSDLRERIFAGGATAETVAEEREAGQALDQLQADVRAFVEARR
jgi:two-component system CheB/CheR fusion protein